MRHFSSLYAAGLVRDLLSQIGVSPRRLRRWTDLPVLVAVYDSDFLAALELSTPIAPSLICALRQFVISLSTCDTPYAGTNPEPTPRTRVGPDQPVAPPPPTNRTERSPRRTIRRPRDVPGQQFFRFA